MRKWVGEFSTATYADVLVLKFGSSHYHADSFEPLATALKAARDASPAGLVVADLDRVLLLSSTALRAIRSIHQVSERNGGRIVMAGGGELVVGVLKFAPFITHHDTVANALENLSSAAFNAYSKEIAK